MKLKVRYDDVVTEIEIDAEAVGQLFIGLSLEKVDGESEEEKEKRIQEAWDEQFNKPEYNNAHKMARHTGYSTARPSDGEDEEDAFFQEPLMEEVMDPRIYLKDELDRESRYEYDAVCDLVRNALKKKPDWAEMFIAVHIDGERVREYAARTGMSENNVTQKLKRAEKKIKEFFENRQI